MPKLQHTKNFICRIQKQNFKKDLTYVVDCIDTVTAKIALIMTM